MSRHARGRRLLVHALAHLGVVVLLVGAAVAPATATGEAEESAACPPDGATVLVEFGDLVADGEQGVRTACDDDVDGERASESIADAGFELTYATGSPGFVCRVQGLPADDPCVRAAPADAYWSVWWAADGGDWVYSTRGAGTLRTPEGGHVALVWHRGAGEAEAPSVPPGTPGDDVGAEPVSATPTEEPEGLPGWVVPTVLVGLGVAVVLVVVRRRSGEGVR